MERTKTPRLDLFLASSSLTSSSPPPPPPPPPPPIRRTYELVLETDAVATQEGLPAGVHDLLPDILLRLPRDDLLSARLVSRLWLHAASHSSFARRYRALHPSSMLGLFYNLDPLDDEELPSLRFSPVASSAEHTSAISRGDFSLGFLPPRDHDPDLELELVNSSDGLLLLSDHDRRRYLVCNPLTREWTELPPPPTHRDRSPFPDGLICLPGDPRCFQVIRVDFWKPGVGPFDIDIFSSATWAWTATSSANSVPYSHPKEMISYTTNLVDGVVYWWHGKHHVLAYQLETSQVSIVQLPGNSFYHGNGWLGMSEEKLCYAQARWIGPCVWTLVGNYPEVKWFLKHQVSWPKLLRPALWSAKVEDALDAIFDANKHAMKGLPEGMLKVMEENKIALNIKPVGLSCDNARIIYMQLSSTLFSLHLYTEEMKKIVGDRERLVDQITLYKLLDSPVPIPMDRSEDNQSGTPALDILLG